MLSTWASACRWAVGDCNDVKEVKQGYLASEQGKVVGKNLKTLLEKGDAENLVAYKPFNGMDVRKRTWVSQHLTQSTATLSYACQTSCSTDPRGDELHTERQTCRSLSVQPLHCATCQLMLCCAPPPAAISAALQAHAHHLHVSFCRSR